MGLLYGRAGCLTALFGGFQPGQTDEGRALACLEFLVTVARVPLSASDNFGDTPLHVAVQEGNKAAAHVLLEHGARQGC
jgi:ankyrin repeat protein